MTRPFDVSRRALLAVVPFAFLAATPALASSGKKDEKKGGKEGEGEKADPVIKLQSMALPIIVDGRLVNYVFVQTSLTLKPEVPLTVFEGKEPMLRDALVREAHAKPFMRSDSYVAIDEARLKASIQRETGKLIGPGKVATVTLIKQTPRNFVPPPPKPGAAAKPAPRPAPSGGAEIVP
ncbi:MAG: hypothetical protein J7521_04990 [Caulobacter sp.]|nr:hypothetical protein [Caulobacter sp.]